MFLRSLRQQPGLSLKMEAVHSLQKETCTGLKDHLQGAAPLQGVAPQCLLPEVIEPQCIFVCTTGYCIKFLNKLFFPTSSSLRI